MEEGIRPDCCLVGELLMSGSPFFITFVSWQNSNKKQSGYMDTSWVCSEWVGMLVWITQKQTKQLFPPKTTPTKNIKQLPIPDPFEQE